MLPLSDRAPGARRGARHVRRRVRALDRGPAVEPARPGEGADADGYIRFWDVIEADTEAEAIKMAEEDYGDYNAISVHGEARSKVDEKNWIARNPD